MIKLNKIYNENCIDTIIKMPDNFIQSIITSPPYFNLRDYGNNKQIGIEDSFKDYLDNLLEVFTNAYRVLKDDGILFVNIGDTYSSKKVGSIKRKTLIGIPDRFKIMMIDKGWICRSDIIWHKPNAIPSSAKDRFVNDYERVFMFTKNEKYKFNTQYEERKTKVISKTNKRQESKYLSDEQEKQVRQGMNKKRGLKLLEKRNHLPEHLFFVDFLRSRTTAKYLFSNVEDVKLSTIEHWFRKDVGGFSFPKLSDWNKVKDFIDDWSDEFYSIDIGLTTIDYEYDDINKNSHKGRIKRSVWSVNTKPSKEKHFAVYPLELINTPILCSTDKNDVVYDPFMGSGTTALACNKLNRVYIGSEINLEYCKIANKRLINEM
jgi:site-specific DNA-methyltransferase (adenine-specific)